MKVLPRKGCDWFTYDVAVDSTQRRRHPTGYGTGRNIGTPIVAASPATFTTSNNRVTLAGAFNQYGSATGDLFVVTGGTGWRTQRAFTILSNTANNVTLNAGQEFPLADNANTTGFILPAGSTIAQSTGGRYPIIGSCSLHSIMVFTADVGASTIEIRSIDAGALLYSVPIPILAAASLPFTVQLGYDSRGLVVPTGFLVSVAAGPTTLAFNLYYRRNE